MSAGATAMRSGMRAFLQVSLLAIFVRAILLVYGEWQDRFLEVKYTDVDYWVFSDAAKALLTGASPYSRSTYRYTPLLAALLIPNQLYEGWGKVLFAGTDLVAGYLLYCFLLRMTSAVRAAKLTALLWLLNPMIFTISTRGNCESLMSCLVLGALYLVTARRLMAGGLLYGLAIHFKLYPVIYGVAILSYLGAGRSIRAVDTSPPMSPKLLANVTPTPSPEASPERNSGGSPDGLKQRRKRKPTTGIGFDAMDTNSNIPVTPIKTVSPALINSALATPGKINTVRLSTPQARLCSISLFGVASAVGFLIPTLVSYWFYGHEYVREALFYHLGRRDHRHNFSPYFYLFYTDAAVALPPFAELFSFLPQSLFFLLAGLKFGRRDLPFACFIITFVFVTFNKVITSQYFVWYLALFPMAYVSMHNISRWRWMAIAGLWFGAQGLWLNLAYKLEFLGINTFVPLWTSSILFMLVNTWIAGQFIRHRLVPEILHAGPGIITLNNAVK